MNFDLWAIDYNMEHVTESRLHDARETYSGRGSALVALVATIAGGVRKLAGRIEAWADGDLETSVITRIGARSH